MDEEFDRIFQLLEGTTTQFGEKFKEIDQTLKKMKEDQEKGAGFSPAQKKDLDGFMERSMRHMEKAEKQFERDSKALSS